MPKGQRGGSSPGERRGGRKKGTPNRATAKTREELWEYIETHQKTNPLEFMIDAVHDPDVDYSLRIQCAREISGYLSSKIKAIDPETGSAEQRIRIRVTLGGNDD